MKPVNPLKAPFGNGTFSRVRSVSYLQWQDAFDVTFDDGIAYLEPHSTIRKANKIAPKQRCDLWSEMKSYAAASSSITTTAKQPKSPGPSFANYLRKLPRNDAVRIHHLLEQD